MVDCFFFFSPLQISTLRQTLPTHLRDCSTFELIIAYVWRLRTIALQLSPDEELRFLCFVNLRSKFNLPLRYYGNVLFVPATLTTSAKLCGNPLGYVVELIRKAKATTTKEYIRFMMDLLVIKGRPSFTADGSYTISNLTRVGFGEVDFGRGKIICGGPITGKSGMIPGMISFCIPFMNKKGEKGIVVPLCLPAPAIDRFIENVQASLQVKQMADEIDSHKQTIIPSTL